MQLTVKALSIALAGFAAVANAFPGYQRENFAKMTGCKLDKAVLPTQSGYENLPHPMSAHPVRVVIGKGTQNYTCAGAEDAAPAAYGAKAQLYDASCLAQNHPELLHKLPGMILNMDSGIEKFLARQISIFDRATFNIGFHIFSDPTTPVFNLLKGGRGEIMYGRKLKGIPAPSTATQGANGAVDWLLIGSSAGSYGLTEAYRVHTAGGKPPASCKGMPEKFEMPYATEYWFY